MKQQIKIIKIICVIIIGLALLMLITTFNNAITLKEEKIKLLENEIDDLYEQLAESNSKLGKYESTMRAIYSIDLNKNNYTYYNIKELDIKKQDYIQDLCFKFGFSYEYVLGIMFAESRFDINAVSYDGSSLGIMQVQDKYSQYYADIIGLKEYDIFNFYDNVLLGFANLVVSRDLWINKGYTDEQSLFWLITGSYNKGNNGMINYYKNNKTYINGYAEVVLDYKMKLEQNIKIN